MTIGVAFSAMSSCLDPTEIVLQLSTNVPCSTFDPNNGVAVALGQPGDDMSGIVTSTTLCSSDGGIGSLVVTPNGGGDPAVGIRVMLGMSMSADSCQAPTFAGCIVARRSLRYVPHTPLTLPIELDSQCANVPCGPYSTCVGGVCVDAGVTGCPGGVCEIPDAAFDASDAAPTCVETSMPVVVESSPAVASPHIARTPTGYAVSWVTSDTYAHIATYAQDGAVVDGEIALTRLGDAGQNIGPLASDGTSYGEIVSDPTNPTLEAWYILTDGGGVIANNAPANFIAPAAGAFYDMSLGRYVAALLTSSHYVGSVVWSTNTSNTSGSPLGAAFDSVSLSASAAGYYLSTHDTSNACNVYACAVDIPMLSLTCSTSPAIPTLNQCASIRSAARDDSDMIAPYFDATTSAFTVHTFVGGVVMDTAASVDDANSYVPLVTGSTPYRLVWRRGDALYTRGYPTSTTGDTLISQLNYGAQGQVGAGFDAVADDPSNSTGYGVVYWSNKGGGSHIFFEHHCQ